MASQTTNLHLKKPALDDDALITDINNNMDLIDTFAGTTNTKLASLSKTITSGSLLSNIASSLADGSPVISFRTNNSVTDQPPNLLYCIGLATRYGNNIHIYCADMVSTKVFTNATSNLGASWYGWSEIDNGSHIAIVSTTGTAPKAITQGQYVIWNGALYTAKSAIASGATLSSSNLQSVSDGGLNSLLGRGSCDMLGVSATPTSSSDTKTLSLSSTIDNYRYILVGNFYNNTGNICYGSTNLPLSIFKTASGSASANRLGLYNGSCLKFWVTSSTSLSMTLLDSTTLPGSYIIVYGIT